MDKITYGVREIMYKKARVGERAPMLIWQYQNGNAVNEYIGYDKVTYLKLYPKRRLIPSTVPLERHDISVYDTRREY